MIELTYFEAGVLIVLALIFLVVCLRSKKVVYVQDRNIYAQLRKEIFDSISEDDRQEIYQKEQERMFDEIKEMLIKQGVGFESDVQDESDEKPEDMSKSKQHEEFPGGNLDDQIAGIKSDD